MNEHKDQAGTAQELVADGTPWNAGYPKAHYAQEWFIAQTTYGDRVVLTALPKEYSYDYKTADGTYIMKEKIACWMQFPDSEFLPPDSEVARLQDENAKIAAQRDELMATLRWYEEQADALRQRVTLVDTSCPQMVGTEARK